MDKENISTTTQILQTYKTLASDPSNHPSLLKDKTILLYTATLLDNRNEKILKLCLDIIENFVQNDDSHQMLLSTFGVFEALESLAIRLRGSDTKLSNRATEVVDILRRSAPPAYSTRLRTKGKCLKKPMLMYQLLIPDLNYENRTQFEDVLVQTRGLVSFVMDMDQQKCTVRLAPKLAIKTVVDKVHEKCGLKCLVATKNPVDFIETFIDVLNPKNEHNPPPDYLPEEDSPPRGKSVINFTNFTKNAGGWFKSATDFLNKSIYW